MKTVMAPLNEVWKDQSLTLITKLPGALCTDLRSRNVDSSCSRHESIRGFPREMPATVLGIRWCDFVSNIDVLARTGLTPQPISSNVRNFSTFLHILASLSRPTPLRQSR